MYHPRGSLAQLDLKISLRDAKAAKPAASPSLKVKDMTAALAKGLDRQR